MMRLQQIFGPLCLVLLSASVCVAQDEAPRESLVLENAAANMQDDGKFEPAIEQWTKLIEQYPKTKQTRSWQFKLGLCQEKVGNHLTAIDLFQKVVADAPADFANTADSWLHLGYNQWLHAKTFANQPDQEKKVNEWSASAVGSLTTVLEKFPQFKNADEVIYFLGEANLTAGQHDKAIAAFDRLVIEFPDSKNWSDAIYALGSCYEERGDFEKAMFNYDRFLGKAPQAPQANEVRFRKAESLLQFGFAAEKAGDKATALTRYDQAEKLYAEVAQVKDFASAGLAAYQRAVVLSRAEQYAAAAAAFAKFATDFPQAESALAAMIAAGQNYLKANDTASAERHFSAALQRDPKSVVAAQLLCTTLLAAHRPADAWDIAKKTLDQSDPKSEETVPLLMAQGEAAFAIPEKVADSIAMYLKIVDLFPQHALAPQALYNACYSSLAAKNPERTIELADKFYAAYPKDSFTADVSEVHAEAALQKQQWEVAENLYRKLVTDYSQNTKLASWQIALTQALVLAGKNDDAIKFATPLVDKITGRDQAALLFHVGSAQFQSKQYEPAAASLARSLAVDAAWPRADEVSLLAARSVHRGGKIEQAIPLAEKSLSDFPQSVLRDQMLYRLGEFQFDAGKFAEAIRSYSQIIEELPKSSFVPSALYGRGWSELRRDKPKEAIASFDVLIEKFPEHALIKEATLARGMARRRSGASPEAAADLDHFIATNPPKAEKLEALYERALIEVDQKNYDAVIERFQELTKLASDEVDAKKWGDKYLYELAWAHQGKNDIDKSVEYFRSLVEKFPDSPLVAEAHFHLGETAYGGGKFDDAIPHYTSARAKSSSDTELAEKAAYKLAWSHYKKQDYAAAEKFFRQLLADFPNGVLMADGLFMISESLFRQKQHEAAVTAYKLALPEVRASTTVREDVKMLTLLHGAQSANEVKQFDEAITFLKPLVDAVSPPEGYAAEAWYEYGTALKGQGKTADAIVAWGKSSPSFDRTGIRARCMIGEALFEDKKFDEAIKEFSLAVYGYGGRAAGETIKPWQAFAAYELARCHLVQISSANETTRPKFIQEAKAWFGYLVEHYPNDKLAAEAKTQITKLEKM